MVIGDSQIQIMNDDDICNETCKDDNDDDKNGNDKDQ